MRTSSHSTPGSWIEVDAQLVGVIEIVRAHRVGMQLDAAEVDDPCEAGSVVDDDFLGGASRWKRERDGSQPVGTILRRALLIEWLVLPRRRRIA